MKKAFTLVELLVVVVVMVTLMTIMFRLAGVGGESAAINKTVDRMHRLENALSGYYAAFGTYPPVKLHGSRNPFLRTNDYGDQSQNGDENGAIWGWCKNDGSGVAAGKLREEEAAWTQVRAACVSQPVACQFPFPDNLMKEFIKSVSDQMKKKAEEMPDGPGREIFSRGFDDGVSENKGRFSQYDDVSDWAIIQLFRFGLMSYLLPRYQIMMNGHADFFDYAQWLGNNTEPRDPLTGRPIGGWKYMQRQFVQGKRSSDLAHISNIPSQAACARWMASFDRTLTCNYPLTLFGVDVWESAGNVDNDTVGGASLKNITVQDIHVPGGYEHGDTSAQYVLDLVTIRDGWGEDFYYYSPAPYQSYVLWSGGPNKRTFPPWISRDTLDSAANRCVGYWIKDDIVNLSH